MATALITGGTSGIGEEFARQLAARGDDLVLVARDADRLAEAAAALKDRYGIAVETVTADLADRSDTRRVVDRLTDAAQPIDILINNAGFGVPEKLTSENIEAHDHAIDVMIRAVLVLAGAAGRVMRARGAGVIINVSSTASFISMGHYSAIKAWVTTFSESLSNELNGSGVHVTALCPGYVRTDFHRRASIRTGRIPSALWLDLDEMVRDGLADVDRGRVVSIPSRRYKTLIFFIRLFPRAAVRAVSMRLTSTRH
ncbi:MAG TPA: SDR family NAD(P)-dependent oxidoreductase [Propionibacteriaceae bacterium]|nr:SDR family NAD(P)-dependent oxidoreductase [Propionibacteriaceae bacterium]